MFAQCAGILLVQKEITQPQSKNPSTVSLHHRRKEWHTAASVALKVRHPSVYLASLVIQVFNPCSLSLIAAASSSSASVVFVCSGALPSPFVCRSRSRLRSAVVFVSVLRRSRSLGVHCSRSLAVCRSSLHSCASGSHVALLQILRPTCALHLAVELLSFVAAVSSLNPPLDNTPTQHQYSASNSATFDCYYNNQLESVAMDENEWYNNKVEQKRVLNNRIIISNAILLGERKVKLFEVLKEDN
ncbi:hypothetical protein Ahy_B01g056194 isoform L [Arachis hypogaea]|uniref:Uncharacterized protein n=1 Tax=Arachis hypogaea TaxID=3818 RepID=A0A445AY83_ARAHY|nr:hypothetical protein Ahy_B01g056194 isoform L [Arachis hypogaea]